EVLEQIPGLDKDLIPAMQEKARSHIYDDAEELARIEEEREAARLAEARRHPDELTQAERLARVRGINARVIEQLADAGYTKVEDLVQEQDVDKLGEQTGLGAKKARQIKQAAEQYLAEEAKLRAELNAEREKEKAARILESAAPSDTGAE